MRSIAVSKTDFVVSVTTANIQCNLPIPIKSNVADAKQVRSQMTVQYAWTRNYNASWTDFFINFE